MYDPMYFFYQYPVNFFVVLFLVTAWELTWKGFGLWHAAQNKQKGWYTAILLINLVGLVPIAYLLWFKPKQKREAPLKQATRSVRRKR